LDTGSILGGNSVAFLLTCINDRYTVVLDDERKKKEKEKESELTGKGR
jgi:hypothetical protein